MEPSMANDIWRWSAAELANAIRDKTLSSREVISAHLERIDAVNDAVNAITTSLAEPRRGSSEIIPVGNGRLSKGFRPC